MIYGKKSYSISKDIAFYDKNSILTPKECMNIATILTEFFNARFPGITNLLNMAFIYIRLPMEIAKN